MALSETQKNNLHRIAQAAVASEKATGCPAALLAAQCILESGWLRHAPENNCFGIKSYPGEHGRQLLATREWFDDAGLAAFLARGEQRTAAPVEPVQQDAGCTLYRVQDWFATFPRLEDCFARRAAMFAAGRYAPFAASYQASGNLEALVRGIAPIYATDPTYADSVLALIHDPGVQAAIAEARAAIPA